MRENNESKSFDDLIELLNNKAKPDNKVPGKIVYKKEQIKDIYDQFVDTVENIWLDGFKKLYGSQVITPSFEDICNSYYNKIIFKILESTVGEKAVCSCEIIDENDGRAWHPLLVVYFIHDYGVPYFAKRTFRPKRTNEQVDLKEFKSLWLFVDSFNK